MAHIITIANSKGGTGKSTTAHTLAYGLYNRGYKTLLIDLDNQANTTFNCGLDINNKETLTSLDFIKGNINAIIHTKAVDIIPANDYLRAAALEVTSNDMLKNALQQVQPFYDYIVIDTPPLIANLTINAFNCSNDIIIPVQADVFSLQGFAQIKQIIEDIQARYNPQLKVAGLLLTRYNSRAIINKDIREMLNGLAKQLKTKVFNNAIPQCIAVCEAQAMQKNLLEYAPNSTAAKQYNAFIDEYLTSSEEA